MTDLISRADAIEAVGNWMQKEYGYLDLNRAERLIDALSALPPAEAVPKRVLQGYNKGANTIQTIRHEELTQIANTRKAVESTKSEPNMIPIKLEKRYPESKDEDITDAFMRGYLNGKADRPKGEKETHNGK